MLEAEAADGVGASGGAREAGDRMAPAGPSRPGGAGRGAASARLQGRAGKIYLALCIVLIAVNLRTVFSSFSAILPEIVAATGMSPTMVSILTTTPVLLLGAFAPAAPPLARRFGPDRVVLGSLALLCLGLAGRGLGPVGALLCGTLAAGIGIAVVNVLLPSLVKRDYQHRLGLMTGLYTGALCGSAALSAGFTEPLFRATGSWGFALAFWAAPVAAVLLLFTPFAVARGATRARSRRHGPAVWRSSTAWHVTAFMIMQAMMSFSVFAWLAPILRARGIDGSTAGVIAAASIALQVVGSFLAPAIAARLLDQRLINVVAAAATGVMFALCVFGPLQLIWLWAVLLGVAQGALTALALAMIVLRTRESHTASRLSGMMQCVGYGLGSSGTLFVGLLHGASGSFATSGIMFLAIGAAAAVFGYRAGRRRYVGEGRRAVAAPEAG